jgi:hypothetical protein
MELLNKDEQNYLDREQVRRSWKLPEGAAS